MNHIVATRFYYTDKNIMRKRLDIMKSVLLPCLQKQTNQNFKWVIWCNPEHTWILRKELDYPFDFVQLGEGEMGCLSKRCDIPKLPKQSHYSLYIKNNNINIQTNHDSDDWMADNYIDVIQSYYKRYIQEYSKFLLYAQHDRYIYDTQERLPMPFRGNNKLTTAMLSLCMEENDGVSVFSARHNKMWQYVDNVIELPDGMASYTIHDCNMSESVGGHKYHQELLSSRMREIKHIVLTRIRFDDKDLLKKYLPITKGVLIPSLKSQVNKNFQWVLLCKKEDVDYLKSELDYPFITEHDLGCPYKEYIKKENINIQTRHDCDDWMSPGYVNEIQRHYCENMGLYDSFIVHSEPTLLKYDTKKEFVLKYHDTRNSMMLSYCTKHNSGVSVFDEEHTKMYMLVDKVIKTKSGLTKWVIHGNNRSVLENRIDFSGIR